MASFKAPQPYSPLPFKMQDLISTLAEGIEEYAREDLHAVIYTVEQYSSLFSLEATISTFRPGHWPLDGTIYGGPWSEEVISRPSCKARERGSNSSSMRASSASIRQALVSSFCGRRIRPCLAVADLKVPARLCLTKPYERSFQMRPSIIRLRNAKWDTLRSKSPMS